MNITNMNIRKLSVSVLATATSAALMAAVPEISDVTMAQSSSRLVTITYTLSDAPAVVTVDVQTNATGDTWASIGGEALWNATGDVWKQVETGSRTITWRPDLSWPDHKIADGGARAVVTAWALDNTPDYMVVDISAAAQPNTQTYYPAADFVPGGVTNSLYKTTTLLMRKIMAKDVRWTMGSTELENQNRQAARENTHLVTLTNNYYIGVYEITQSQWSLVDTNKLTTANFTTEGFMRPMENVNYNEVRSGGTEWSWPVAPKPSNFIGRLRSRTGLDFDLPSEAQWEFAARAGNGVGYWNDGSAILNANPDANLNLLGRYQNNPTTNSSATPATSIEPSVGGTAIVGSYAPNAWGLYDMHGNVFELCLDWYEDNINAHGGKVNADTSNPQKTLSGASGTYRVVRGGSWNTGAGSSRPAYRAYSQGRANNIGFRVLCTSGLR